MSYASPADVTTSPGTNATSFTWTGATGGATTIATTGVGGNGSGWSLTMGAGGLAASANTSSTGGNGGTGSITGAAGGAATATGTNVGGNGSDLVFAGGSGGNASGGSSNTGGNGGSIYIVGGAFGTGGTANGSVGNVILGHTSAGTERGQTLIGAGTVALPGIAFKADPDSGIYRIGANEIGIAVNGALALDIATTGVSVAGAWLPTSSDGGALGSATKMWSDLFLASGAVINFNNGDVTITHSANALALAGASSGYTFDALVSPAANDGAALGTGTVSFSDLFLATGGVINWANSDVTITHSANTLAFAGASAAGVNGYSFDMPAGTIASESHGVDVTATGTLASGKNLVGLNVAATAAGTAGSWLAGIYAKAVQSSKMVNGYLTAAEFELVSTAANPSDNAVMVLNATLNHTGSPAAADPYIMLRDYGTTHANCFVRIFNDTGQSGTANATTLISTTADSTATHAVRCMLGSTPFWLLGTTTAPH